MPKSESNHSPSFSATGAAWIVLGAVAYFLQAELADWLFNGLGDQNWRIQGIFLTNCLCLATLVGVSSNWVNAFPEGSPNGTLRRRLVCGNATVLLGSVTVFAFLYWILFPALIGRNCLNQFHFWSEWTIAALITHSCLVLYESSRTQRRQTLQIQLEADRLNTSVDLAEMAMLEAQIEPHFLFNSIAHVKRQYRLDPTAADQMLDGLIDYLEKATPALHRSDWKVSDELGLVRVYLEILARRFGERLHFSIDASDACNALPLPALTVTTLVENAVRHGLAPKSDGGRITVSAKLDGKILQLEVCDNGVGLRKTSGTGLGLATVRARLQSAFNNAAHLYVGSNEPQGTRATIRIPGINHD